MTAATPPIRSRDNPQFKVLRKLAESGRERRKSGLTLLDGLRLIEAWQASGRAVEKIALSATGIRKPEIARWLKAYPQVPVLVIADGLFDELANLESQGGVIAVVELPERDANPRSDVDCVLLDGVQDPGNVGTIMRTAVAAGFSQVLLTGDCAQAWSPKTLRAGMGAHFALHIVEEVDAVAYLESYRGTVAVTDLAGPVSLYEADTASPVAWVFGSEGEGVRAEVAATADMRVRIPMSLSSAAVASLNVAAAAAICLFETVRRRSGPGN